MAFAHSERAIPLEKAAERLCHLQQGFLFSYAALVVCAMRHPHPGRLHGVIGRLRPPKAPLRFEQELQAIQAL
jgi:hypothetical protein